MLNKAKASDDVNEVRRRSEELMTAAHALAQMLYQQGQSQHGPTGGPSPHEGSAGTQSGSEPRQTDRSGDNVVDADFEILDDDKNKGKQP